MSTAAELLTLVNNLYKVKDEQAQQIDEQAQQIVELNQQVKELSAQLAWFKRQMFGQKSEKNLDLPNMPSLFTEEELAALGIDSPTPSPEEQPAEETPEKQAKKGKPTQRRHLNWDELPILETQTIEPEGVDPTRFRKMGEEVTYQVCFKPGMLYRRAIIRPKYGLIDPTEPVTQGEGVKIAPMPLLPIYKGIPDASLLAEILLQKYEYHMPFYRQIKQFAHLGLEGLKETTMVEWFRRTMELLTPLYNTLVAEVFKCKYVQADETTVPVINKETHKADKEYLWMARAVMERLVVFFYEKGSRSGEVIKKRTDAYKYEGYLQCDGFDGYDKAFRLNASVCLVNCMVHIRRAFQKALDENRESATWFLVKIRQLYHIEHQCDDAGMDDDQRRAVRQEKSKPIMDEMKKWMETVGIKYSERSLIGKAVTYAYNRWGNMMRVLEDGRLLLDNNLGENEIRPITLGRKNYLFCGNHEAAMNMCVIVSLLATCRNHNVNPREYLNDVIAKMPLYERASQEELVKLLPHRWIESHPEAKVPDIRKLAK